TNPENITADFEQALKLDPKYVPALQQLAALQAARHKYDEALSTLDRLDAAGDPTFSTRLMRGQVQAQQGKAGPARESYAAARALAKGNANALNSLCWSEATVGSAPDEALKDCDAALAVAPDIPAFVDSRGLALLKLKRYQEAVASYDVAIAKAPKQTSSLYGRGIAKLRLGRQAEGEADIAAAREIEPSVGSRFAEYGVQR
ncbi:MAG TPA: tetratricopeptide repeat protein, partial [Steroidobacteraceae bacterium]|nr:tetratricopeptide repeat protein [Steroidobacteraceae bacterium]